MAPIYREVDRNSAGIADALEQSPVYKKTGYFRARYAGLRERVPVLLADGRTESFAIARRGDWVVLSASGGTELVPGERFRQEYEETEDKGVYVAKALIKAVRNPYGEAVEIQSERGFPQKGRADCYFADAYTEESGLAGDVYLIEGNVFEKNYSIVE